MTHFDCCRFRQASSNDLPNNQPVGLPYEQPQVLTSDATPASSTSSEDLQPIRAIFASSNRGTDLSEDQGFQEFDLGPKRVMLFSIRHKESNGRLHDIARILRKRISRESNVSKRSSKKNCKSSVTEEHTERRRELRRALHRRLEEELLHDRATSDDGYDSDAVPIKTPAGSWGRNGGPNPDDSDQTRQARRFETSSQSLGRGPSHQICSSRHDVDHSAYRWQQSPNLHLSRSVNFAESVARNHAPTASRRRSIQNITRKPSSLGPTTGIPGNISDHENGSTSSEVIGTTGPDSYRFQVKTPEEKNAVQQRPRSFSLDCVSGTTSHASPKLRGPSGSLASLNSNAQNQQNLQNLNGHKKLSAGSTHLKVPGGQAHGQRVASSNYSSYNDSLESSRRSSLLKIQSLSERLACLKNTSNNDSIYEGWSSALDVSRVPVLQLTLSEIDEVRRRTSDTERLHPSTSSITNPESSRKKSGDISQREVENPRTGFHEDLIVRPNREISQKNIFPIKPQDSEPRSLSNLGGSSDWSTSGRRHGYFHDFIAQANEDPPSLWEESLRHHAEVDSSPPQTMPTTRLSAPLKSLDRRTLGSEKRKVRPGLQRGVEYKSTDIWKGHLRQNSGGDLKAPIPMDTYVPENLVVLKGYNGTMAPSWCRYPSHTRAERSLSPAGVADHVISRDFAIESRKIETTHEHEEGKAYRKKKKKSRSATFGRNMMTILGRIYNMDLRRQHRGHRSSISVGGKLEYPELEILPQLSPILQPLDEASKREVIQVFNTLPQKASQQEIAQKSYRDDETINGAKNWSKLYEDCVHCPIDADESWIEENTSRIFLRSRTVSDSTKLHASKGEFSPRSSGEMRSSTLDFQRALQDHEAKAKKRALQAADNAWGRSASGTSLTPNP